METASSSKTKQPKGVPTNVKKRWMAAKREVEKDKREKKIGDSMKAVLKVLDEYHEQQTVLEQRTVGDYLAENGAAEIIKVYLNIFKGHPTKNRRNLEDLEKLLFVVMMYTDASTALSEAIARCEILQILTSFLEKYKAFRGNPKTEGRIVMHSLTILYNCSMSSSNKKYYGKKIVEVVGLYAEEKQIDTNRACAILTLAHILDEIPVAEKGIISFLVEIMIGVLRKKDRRSDVGFTAKELALGLTKLANNNKNSVLILQSGALQQLQQLIEKGNEEEKVTAVNCIWELSFDKQNKEKITKNSELIKTLEKFTGNKNKKLKEAASGALWELKDKNKRKKGNLEVKTDPQHLMLSYRWKHQQTVIRIKRKLQSNDFTVWMDIDKVSGDIMQAMAEAVEQSALIIICMSPDYPHSQHCRSEAQYAYELEKPIIPLKMEKFKPSGWLGLLVTQKRYINFTDLTEFETSSLDLIREIEQLRKKGGDGKDEPQAKRWRTNDSEAAQRSSSGLNMTSEDVQRWAEQH